MYGGIIRRDGGLFSRTRSLDVPDKQIIAFSDRSMPHTLVGVHNLDRKGNAAKWTALQAYQAKGGIIRDVVRVEVPGTLAHTEARGRLIQASRQRNQQSHEVWQTELARLEGEYSKGAMTHDQYLAAMEKAGAEWDARSEANAAINRNQTFFTTTAEASEDNHMARYFDALGQNISDQISTVDEVRRLVTHTNPSEESLRLGTQGLIARAAHQREMGEALRASDPVEGQHTVTILQAHGTDLPSSVDRLYEGYSELTFHATDPDVTVANAFGAESMAHFTSAWAESQTQATPLAAGQVMLRSLMQ